MLFRFQQEAHQHRQYLPEDSDLMSWLAMMQHRWAPTRLLDWTWSLLVAAYFALEDESEKAAIWAIDLSWLEERGNVILQSKGRKPIPSNLSDRASYLNQLLSEREEQRVNKTLSLVVRVEPRKTDAWMSSQRGFFLCKCFETPSLPQLVMRMMMHPTRVSTPIIRKLEISGALRFDFLRQLQISNIHRGSLFPDLDGFSKSLNINLRIQMDQLRMEYQKSAMAVPLPSEETEGENEEGNRPTGS